MRSKAFWVGLLVAAFIPASAWAASLQVTPVTVLIPPGQSAAVLTLKNQGDKPVQAQVRVFAWSQKDGQDKLDMTQTLVASPPMIEVGPQGTQTIRLVRASKAAVTSEENYRVLIDEVPDPAALGGDGVNLLLRYSIPAFLPPVGVKPARLTATTGVEGTAVTFKAQNVGGQHAQVSAVSLVNAAGDAVVVEAGLVGYVLVGQTMQWRLRIPPDAAARGPFLSLRCRINGEPFSAPL